MRFFIAFMVLIFGCTHDSGLGLMILMIGWKISDQIEELRNLQNL